MSSTTKPQSPSGIAQQYQGVITALIPFASRGKLSEGLNKFRSRIDQSVLEEIRYEVNRLITPSDTAVSNKRFAEGRTSEVRVGEVVLDLDARGQRMLETELRRYNRTYTQGVQEALNSPERYQQQKAFEEQQALIEKFSVNCVSPNTPLEPERVKVVPDFTLRCEAFEDGKPQTFHYLGAAEIALQFKRKPSCQIGQQFDFDFPPLDPIAVEGQTIPFTCQSINPMPGRKQYSATFKPRDPDNICKQLLAYIEQNLHDLPLDPVQEERRTRNQLLNDAVITNMPFTAMLCGQQDGNLQPKWILETCPTLSNVVPSSRLSTCKKLMRRLSGEFRESREIYLFGYQTGQGENQRLYFATMRELIRDKLFGSFIHMGQQQKTLRVLRLNLVSMDDASVRDNLLSRGLSAERVDQLRYIIYSSDVSCELSRFQVNRGKIRSFNPSRYAQSDAKWDVASCLPRFCDRRLEARFDFNALAEVKVGWLNSVSAKVIDISRTGLRLRLNAPMTKFRRHVSVKIPALQFSGVRYTVVGGDQTRGELRLAMTPDSQAKFGSRFDSIFAHNVPFFNQHNQQDKTAQVFDYMWDLVCASLPGVHILLGPGDTLSDQLIIAMTDGTAQSIAPFKVTQNKLPTHGWLADKHRGGGTPLAHAMHDPDYALRCLFYVNRQAGKFSPIADRAFDGEQSRRQLFEAIRNQQGKLIAHTLKIGTYQSLDSSWYQKRCKHLTVVDKLAVSRLKKQEHDCKRILSVIPVTHLHQNLLVVGEFLNEHSLSNLGMEKLAQA